MTTTSFSIRRWLLRLLLGAGLAALAMLALAVIFIAVPLTRRLLVVPLAEWMLGGRLESLAVDLDLQPNLRWIFTLLIVLPVGFGLARTVMACAASLWPPALYCSWGSQSGGIHAISTSMPKTARSFISVSGVTARTRAIRPALTA